MFLPRHSSGGANVTLQITETLKYHTDAFPSYSAFSFYCKSVKPNSHLSSGGKASAALNALSAVTELENHHHASTLLVAMTGL